MHSEPRGSLTLPTPYKITSFPAVLHKNHNVYRVLSKIFPRKHRTPSRLLTITCLCLVRTFGKMAVAADWKWEDIFHHCYTILGCHGDREVETSKAWEIVAVMVSNGRKALKDDGKRSALIASSSRTENLNVLSFLIFSYLFLSFLILSYLKVLLKLLW